MVHYKISDHNKLAKELLSRGDFTLELLKKELEKRCRNSLFRQLKKYEFKELSPMTDNDGELEKSSKLCDMITDICTNELNHYTQSADLGIEFGKVVMTNGFELIDENVKEDFARKAQSEIQIQANMADARAIESRQKADAIKEIEAAEKIRKVASVNQQSQADIKSKQLEIIRKEKKQELDLRELEQESRNKMEEMARVSQNKIKELEQASQNKIRQQIIEITQREKREKADNEAYSISTVAKANFEKGKLEVERATLENDLEMKIREMQNETGSNIPENIQKLKQMEIMVKGIQAHSNSAWIHPEPSHLLYNSLTEAGAKGTLLDAFANYKLLEKSDLLNPYKSAKSGKPQPTRQKST